jgi:hypothetical protein
MAYRVQSLPKKLSQPNYPSYLTQFIKGFKASFRPFSQRDRARIIIFYRSKALVDSLFNALQP